MSFVVVVVAVITHATLFVQRIRKELKLNIPDRWKLNIYIPWRQVQYAPLCSDQ